MTAIVDTPDVVTSSILEDSHGWPESLCVIEVSPGKYAANHADTKGLEPDPQKIDGLAVFETEASANDYMGALNGLSGTVVPKTFAECRQIVVDKNPKITAMFLMVGSSIKDVIHVC